MSLALLWEDSRAPAIGVGVRVRDYDGSGEGVDLETDGHGLVRTQTVGLPPLRLRAPFSVAGLPVGAYRLSVKVDRHEEGSLTGEISFHLPEEGNSHDPIQVQLAAGDHPGDGQR